MKLSIKLLSLVLLMLASSRLLSQDTVFFTGFEYDELAGHF